MALDVIGFGLADLVYPLAGSGSAGFDLDDLRFYGAPFDPSPAPEDPWLWAKGPAGTAGTPAEGPGSPWGPFGAPVESGGPQAPVVPGAGTGDPPLMQLVPVFDPVRLMQNSQLMARGWNSLVYHKILRLVAGEPTDRQIVIDPAASPLFPGGGLTVRASAPGSYGTFT